MKAIRPKSIQRIESQAWKLVNLKWKKFNADSPVLYRFMIRWENECEKHNYKPNYTFSDCIA